LSCAAINGALEVIERSKIVTDHYRWQSAILSLNSFASQDEDLFSVQLKLYVQVLCSVQTVTHNSKTKIQEFCAEEIMFLHWFIGWFVRLFVNRTAHFCDISWDGLSWDKKQLDFEAI